MIIPGTKAYFVMTCWIHLDKKVSIFIIPDDAITLF